MQVNVFVSVAKHVSERTQMLVLPLRPDARIPSYLQTREWRFFTTTDADDRCIGLPPGEVSVALCNADYVLTTPKAGS